MLITNKDIVAVDTTKLSILDYVARNYSQTSFTQDQLNLLYTLNDFFTNDIDNIFIIKGYAGTGKTYMIKVIVESLLNNQRECFLMAPTGKAAKVLQDVCNHEASTIQSRIYEDIHIDIQNDLMTNSFEDLSYKVIGSRAPSPDSNIVLIIDEASMISAIKSSSDNFSFGSNNLLDDIISYANFDSAHSLRKLIFVGDDAQLPPIGSKTSFALSAEFISNKYKLKVRSFELKQVVRQRSSSTILCNANKVRQSIATHQILQFDYANDFCKINFLNLTRVYLEHYLGLFSNEICIIARDNKSVSTLNSVIRQTLYGEDKPYLVRGDKLIVVNNNYLHNLFNGDFVYVLNADKNVEIKNIKIKQDVYVKLYFRNVVLLCPDKIPKIYANDYKALFEQFKVDSTLANNCIKRCRILDNLLHIDKGSIDLNTSRALFIDFCQRASKNKIHINTPMFDLALKNDEYFNALQVKFGYALTCHKAQGSEWPYIITVFSNNYLYQDLRWTYTAITRASLAQYVINAKDSIFTYKYDKDCHY